MSVRLIPIQGGLWLVELCERQADSHPGRTLACGALGATQADIPCRAFTLHASGRDAECWPLWGLLLVKLVERRRANSHLRSGIIVLYAYFIVCYMHVVLCHCLYVIVPLLPKYVTIIVYKYCVLFAFRNLCPERNIC